MGPWSVALRAEPIVITGKPREKGNGSAWMARRRGVDDVQWMNYLGAIPWSCQKMGSGLYSRIFSTEIRGSYHG
jgi:hypothetical protein